MIPGVVACGVGVEAVGTGGGVGVDTAAPGTCACDNFFRCPDGRDGRGGRETAAEAGGT